MIQVNVSELRGEIAKNGYSLRGFAKKSEISISYLSAIVNKKANPSPKMASHISKELNVPMDNLFTYIQKEA